MQTFYSLYSLEITLGELTGRPSSIHLSDVSVIVPPPEFRGQDYDELPGLSTPSSAVGQGPPDVTFTSGTDVGRSTYLSSRISLCILSHRITSSLYRAGSDMAWSDVQNAIRRFDFEMQQWHLALPGELDFREQPEPTALTRLGVELALYYWSIRMMLFRPCLCDMTDRVEHESRTSQDFNQLAAKTCVDAAISMLGLLPPRPPPEEAYQILPWCLLLHYVCQAAAALILELCLEDQHAPSALHVMVDGVKKALYYLEFMGVESLSAYKAWKTYRRFLQDATERFGLDVSDLPPDVPHPREWTAAMERALTKALDDTARPTDPATLSASHPMTAGF